MLTSGVSCPSNAQYCPTIYGKVNFSSGAGEIFLRLRLMLLFCEVSVVLQAGTKPMPHFESVLFIVNCWSGLSVLRQALHTNPPPS